ncbi:MAG: N-acetylmuramic acid 6-phosphate etherase [Candidatus Zixiibacteriota bacterium]
MSDKTRKLINHLQRLETESSNPKSLNIDRLPAVDICRIINQEDQTVASAIAGQISIIAKTADKVADIIRNGGGVFYIGAGTSGRLGVLDAAEIPPTFGTDPSLFTGVIAGGRDTLVLSKEGVEDETDQAKIDLAKFNLTTNDMLIGLAASIKTPYTIAGIKYAQIVGAATALIVCNDACSLEIKPDFLIQLKVGPEVITGSTRMKSGTAQKMTLNMISTTAMILLGKCYGNLMVDLKATSNKLKARSRKILIELLEIDYDEADKLLEESGGSVKIAIAMRSLGIDGAEAEKRLGQSGGFLWKLLDQKQ